MRALVVGVISIAFFAVSATIYGWYSVATVPTDCDLRSLAHAIPNSDFVLDTEMFAAPIQPPIREVEQSVAAMEYFESHVRPVLAQHCYGCHGPEKQKAGLRLDDGSFLNRPADDGAIVKPGDPDSSPIIRAVRFDDDLKMPPSGKLSAPAISALETWVRMGAPWPGTTGTRTALANPKSIEEARNSHWSFQPVRKPSMPAVKLADWPSSPIDLFVLSQLEAKEMTPSKPADRRTLIRRVTFDLIGLPPTPEEVDAFVNDTSPHAFATVVDRLLASPQYGERWARYWLDVARYADTKGYVYDGEERRYPFSFTYRDYVIQAFNDDKPYDQFLLEQIAADCLPQLTNRSSLAAMGFLTLGRRFVNNMHDVIDDRIDVIFRGTQALTVSCARCHDHKFDPIPTSDYYSLYGVLENSTERTVPIGEPAGTTGYAAYRAELARREQARDNALAAARHELSERLRGMVPNYLMAVLDAERQPGDNFYVILAPDDINPVIVRRWQSYLLRTKRDFHRVFGPWHEFASIATGEFAQRAPELARRIVRANPIVYAPRGGTEGEIPALNPLVAQAFAGAPPTTMRQVAERYGQLFAGVHTSWRDLLQTCSPDQIPPTALPDPAEEELRQVLYAAESPTTVPDVRIHEIEAYFDEETRGALNRAQAEVDRLHLESPDAPPHAAILQDSTQLSKPFVFIQGNPKLKGDEVERQFLELIDGENRRPFQSGSGRLELAQRIASRENPLTARVMVNRIWLHHFGTALVGTPSNFGLSGMTPTHPELLDFLAWQFMQDGWSVKNLHRLILLSSTYQQSSGRNLSYAHKDPENHQLWRMNRRRLDFEATRDSFLAVSQRLDTAWGGRPVSWADVPMSGRRTIYGFIDRQNLPGLFSTFDFANPDQHTPQRPNTIVPQQALFLMNSPFVMAQAESLARNPRITAYSQAEDRICELYRTIFQRSPSLKELDWGLQFLDSASLDEYAEPDESELPNAWSRYVQVLLMTNEFVFVD